MNIKDKYKVKVSVQTAYQADQSNPTAPYFFFSYTIAIENHHNNPVKLLSRFWEIWDPGSENHFVEGEGVVGKQPTIEPGEDFQYSSFCHLRSPFGKMEGYYTFEDQITGETFFISVPALWFQYPIGLN
ncbi:Co2+/Mg2+ efflux protein ApaG [Luteibaculum oceani]|uniref:Co2+/Mg2+ efflux protein ApaG n=1 Tax=Luteibaculum oceani TaxID=1294296 RepID=A0A5C6UZ84_9FLAO|nr:Co2+/Mg2+ efflux protein ApaG [Luteibaculum oceani]TXC78577.1 Co2+/Mg2+ efflux protein ApaG [Luteibaculum oceani]